MAFPALSQAKQCSALLDEPKQGAGAVSELGKDLGSAADRNEITNSKLAKILKEDKSAWLDRCGNLFIQEPPIGKTTQLKASKAAQPTIKLASVDEALSLHSRPGSDKVVYLNFEGEASHTDTRWSQSSFSLPAFSADSDVNKFSEAELLVIRQVWQATAEDFATFDIDVTTEKPAAAQLIRADLADLNYGTTVTFTSRWPWSDCKCGGMATVGTFNRVGQPATTSAFVITSAAGTSPRALALVASHEAGHNFGLWHWGLKRPGFSSEYAGGKNVSWGPIMGYPGIKTLTHWSNGDFPNAWNKAGAQDDLKVIASNGVTPLTDDIPDDKLSAQLISAGLAQASLIGSRDDVDWFKFTSLGGEASVAAASAASATNLDIQLDLFDSSGTLIESSNPALIEASVCDWSCGTQTKISRQLSPGTYYVRVDGSGYGGLSVPDRYSDYGSIGPYQIVLDSTLATIEAEALPNATRETKYMSPLNIREGSLPTVSVVADDQENLPRGMYPGQVGSGFALRGAPFKDGFYTFTLRTRDAAGQSGPPTTFSLTVDDIPNPAISPGSLPGGKIFQKYSTSLTAATIQPYQRWSVTSLPPGLKMLPRDQWTGSGPAVIEGTPTAAGTFPVNIVASSQSGKETHVIYPLVIEPDGPPNISTTSLETAVIGRNYPDKIKMGKSKFESSVRLTAGALPKGLTLMSSGIFRGKALVAGTYSFTVVAADIKKQQSAPKTLSIQVVENKPALRENKGRAERGGTMLITFVCSNRLGCSPGSGTVYLSVGSTTEGVRVAWPAIDYGKTSAFRVMIPAALNTTSGSTVKISSTP